MTQDEIIRMAREAGFEVDEGLFPFEATEDKYIGTERVLERFAAIVAAHWQKIHTQEMSMMSELCADRILEERKACAKVCDNVVSNHGYVQSEFCAAAIRARGEK